MAPPPMVFPWFLPFTSPPSGLRNFTVVLKIVKAGLGCPVCLFRHYPWMVHIPSAFALSTGIAETMW